MSKSTYKSTYNSSCELTSRLITRLQVVLLLPQGSISDGRLGIHFKMEDRNDLIEHYFNLGYQQKEILSCLLLIHDQSLSSRQLRRILALRGLTRRKHVSKLSTVINRKERELQSSGRNIGYRSMWQRPRG